MGKEHGPSGQWTSENKRATADRHRVASYMEENLKTVVPTLDQSDILPHLVTQYLHKEKLRVGEDALAFSIAPHIASLSHYGQLPLDSPEIAYMGTYYIHTALQEREKQLHERIAQIEQNEFPTEEARAVPLQRARDSLSQIGNVLSTIAESVEKFGETNFPNKKKRIFLQGLLRLAFSTIRKAPRDTMFQQLREGNIDAAYDILKERVKDLPDL